MPKFGWGGSGRTAPYDRAALSQSKVYSAAGVAPHGETTRWTYTVPSGKLALAAVAQAALNRLTAAAPVGYAYATVKHNDGTVTAPVVVAATLGNAVGSGDGRAVGSQLVMNTGTILTGTTADGSTGGTINYEVSALIYEFNA